MSRRGVASSLDEQPRRRQESSGDERGATVSAGRGRDRGDDRVLRADGLARCVAAAPRDREGGTAGTARSRRGGAAGRAPGAASGGGGGCAAGGACRGAVGPPLTRSGCAP